MNLLPRGLGARVVTALGAAVAGLVALQYFVIAGERAAAAAAPAWVPPSPTSSPLSDLGFRLVPIAGVVSLATRLSAIPPDQAPVLQVLADGSLALRRPPGVSGAPGGAWRDLAVVVPNEPLADWSATARGALADVLGACLGARPVLPERVRIVDAPITAADIVSLLAWLP